MLPYLEQENLWRNYNYNLASSASNPYGRILAPNPNPNPNHTVAAQTLKVFTCPSDTNPPPVETRNPYQQSDFYEMVSAARSNYLFSTGAYTDYDGDWNSAGSLIAARGAFGNNGAVRIDEVRDGTSNTIAIGESVQRWHTSTVYGPYWGTGTHTAVHGRGYFSNFTPNYPYGPCAPNPGSGRLCTYAWGFSSFHPGTTNFVFLDGSVRGISDGIPFLTFRHLCTPDGGEVVSLD